MSALRIALADDQVLVRAALRALLQQQGITVVCEADDGQALLDALATHHVDVVLSDIRMPGLDGIAALEQLRARGDRTPVLLLTTFDDSDLLLRACEAGAQGFLLKDAAPDDLHEAIARVAAGETLLQPVSTDPVRARYQFRDQQAPRETFNEREVAILRLARRRLLQQGNRPHPVPGRRHGEELRLHHPGQARHPRPHPRGAEGDYVAGDLRAEWESGLGIGK